MRWLSRALATSCAAVVFACGALVGLEPLTFDEDGGTDALSEASRIDGMDATGSDAPDGSSAFTCGDADDFCDDFERAAPVQGLWTSYGVRATGVGFLEAGAFFSEIRTQDAAVMETPASGFSLDVPWSETDAGTRRRVHVRLRASVEACPAAGFATMISVGLGSKVVEIILERDVATCIVRVLEIVFPTADAGTSYRSSPPLVVPLGAWEQYELELPEPSVGAGGDAILRVGSEERMLSLIRSPGALRYYQVLGLSTGVYAGADARVRYDWVRIDYLR
jgi:hypothetical protein